MPAVALSLAGYSQRTVPAGDVAVSRRTWQALERNLAKGDLMSAHATFNTYRLLIRIGATASPLASDPHFAAKFAVLGKALKTGNLHGALSALATVKSSI